MKGSLNKVIVFRTIHVRECALLETMSNPLPQLNEAAAAGGCERPQLGGANNRQTDGQNDDGEAD